MARYIEKDIDDQDSYEERENARTNWLIPLLIIPVFFVLGWLANDFAKTNTTAQNLQQQYGIGGAPDNGLMVSPSPMTGSSIDGSSTGSTGTVSGDIHISPMMTGATGASTSITPSQMDDNATQ